MYFCSNSFYEILLKISMIGATVVPCRLEINIVFIMQMTAK